VSDDLPDVREGDVIRPRTGGEIEIVEVDRRQRDFGEDQLHAKGQVGDSTYKYREYHMDSVLADPETELIRTK
jgi:hypothetical protein